MVSRANNSFCQVNSSSTGCFYRGHIIPSLHSSYTQKPRTIRVKTTRLAIQLDFVMRICYVINDKGASQQRTPVLCEKNFNLSLIHGTF